MVHYTWVAVVAAALYAGWIFASRWLNNRPEKPEAEPGQAAAYVPDTKLKISQFYASPSEFVEGGKALLCYGVENAMAVRVEPPVDGVWPSRNRCVEVAPAKTTTYKLIAEGADGKAETQTTQVTVSADPASLPKVVYFSAAPAKQTVAEKGTDASGVWSICYQVANAAEVSVDPPVIPATSAPNGCFYNKPGKTTTFTLTATDTKGRKATKRVTVKVQP
jgi:hypothetical protein